MDIRIAPGPLAGTVTPPPSKSQAHRLLIAAALADGESVIHDLAGSQDITATRRCLEELGAELETSEDGCRVRGMSAGPMSPLRRLAYPHLDCGESGSTLRFLIPVALAVRGGGIFTGRGRLMERPLGPYFDIFREKGIFYEQKDGALTVQGELKPGEYRLPGNVSSQFFTGLLYALPLLEGDSYLIPTTPVESWDYILMTIDALSGAGVAVEEPRQGCPYFYIHGGQTYSPIETSVEPDWSQAAFWYAANALGSEIAIEGMDPDSVQGDRVIAQHAERLSRPGDVELDVSQCPDLVPALAVMAAVRQGTTRIVNAARLRLKESDRIAATVGLLNALDGWAAETEDGLIVNGVPSLRGGTVDACSDHRIAMAAAIAATACCLPVTVLGAECVNKSYPDFWEEYQRLGGELHVCVSGE